MFSRETSTSHQKPGERLKRMNQALFRGQKKSHFSFLSVMVTMFSPFHVADS